MARETTTERLLRSVLEKIVDQEATGRSIQQIRKTESAYASSARLTEIQLDLSDGSTLQLIHKESGAGARLDSAPRDLPRFLHDPEREILVYQRLLAAENLDTALLHASVVQPRQGRYWMFFERLPGTHLRWAVDPAAWDRSAAWLARAHTVLHPQAADSAAWLPVHDANYYRRWLRRARAITEPRDQARRIRLAWLARHYGGPVDLLSSLPRTVIHGEFYPSNILVDESRSAGRIGVVDWEMAAVGPAIIDLAALTGGQLPVARREAILAAYRATAPPDSVVTSDATSAEALACARLHFAIQWLGWAPDWAPPAEQRHDWLAEAVELGETMGW